MTRPPDTNQMQPDHAPTPYSAAEIRHACRPGRRNTYRIEANAEDPYLMATEWVRGGDSSGEARFTKLGIDGVMTAGPGQTEMAWDDLQAQASYPADLATIEETTVQTAAGTFDAWLYTVERNGLVEKAWFATHLPGPPVLKIDERDGQVESRMELVELDRSE